MNTYIYLRQLVRVFRDDFWVFLRMSQ